jgi:hypothetical protein
MTRMGRLAVRGMAPEGVKATAQNDMLLPFWTWRPGDAIG